MDELKGFSELIEDDIYREISVETCVSKRNLIGGPAREAVMKSIQRGKDFLLK